MSTTTRPDFKFKTDAIKYYKDTEGKKMWVRECGKLKRIWAKRVALCVSYDRLYDDDSVDDVNSAIRILGLRVIRFSDDGFFTVRTFDKTEVFGPGTTLCAFEDGGLEVVCDSLFASRFEEVTDERD